MAFRSHWRFSSEFCTPGEGHEKSGVEAEVDTFRRNHWVPVPKARDLAELNAQLLEGCHADAVRTVTGHEQTVGAGMLLEREHLLPLAEEGFDLAEASFPTVNTLGCLKVRTNAYSCPVRAGTTVSGGVLTALAELLPGARGHDSASEAVGGHGGGMARRPLRGEASALLWEVSGGDGPGALP